MISAPIAATPGQTQPVAQVASAQPIPFRTLVRRRLKGLALLALKPVFLAAGLALYAALRLIEPWKKIRVGLLNYERLGHLALHTEVFLRNRAAGLEPKDVTTILVSGPPANHQILKMIARRAPVLDSRLALHVYFQGLRPIIAGSRFHELLAGSVRDYAAFADAGPQLSFTPEEEERGRLLLSSMGVGPGNAFVCFHSRDKAYLDREHTYRTRAEWSYHDYRDCKIENYLPAARNLAARGLTALRMGSAVETPLSGRDAGIIDYATRFRDDFADIYLLARCKFLLCSTSGVIGLPPCFNIPVAAANYVPLGYAPWRGPDLFIPKTYSAGGRPLPFREIISRDATLWTDARLFKEAGITVVENSAEDIAALADEMNARLDGRWHPEPGDEELQRRFRGLFPKDHPITGFPSRVGAAFLRRHKDLLN